MLAYYPQIETIYIDANGFRVPVGGVTVEFYNITQDVSITSIVSDSEGVIDAGSLNSASEPVNLLDVVELRHGTYDGTARIILQASAEEAAKAVENNVSALILQDDYTNVDPDAAIIFWQDLGNPDVEPQYLATVLAVGSTNVPFVGVEGKTYRFYVARQHRDWDFHAANKEQLSYQDLFIGEAGSSDSPPTFSTVAYDSVNSEVDLTFAKNGAATGNIEVEYKLTSSSSWTTHGTTFAHGDTSGSIVITEQPTAQTYDIRLKQVGVAGYSTVRQVTVEASGGGTPPTNLSGFETFVIGPPDEYDVSLFWDAGSGSGNYTVERKSSSGGTWGVVDAAVALTNYTDTGIIATSTGRTYYYRVKQNDVTGYSNEASVFIPRDGTGF